MMSPEVSFYRKLKRTYSLHPPVEATPLRQIKCIEKTNVLSRIGSELGITNMYFLESVFYPNGKIYEYKIPKLKQSLEVLKENFGEDSLDLLDPDCIRKNGSINFKKFKIIIEKST